MLSIEIDRISSKPFKFRSVLLSQGFGQNTKNTVREYGYGVNYVVTKISTLRRFDSF